MNITGEFEIHDTFKIQNGSIVLAGKIIAPDKSIFIRSGDKISFTIDAREMSMSVIRIETGFGIRNSDEYFHQQNAAIETDCDNEWQKILSEKLSEGTVRARLISDENH